MIEIWRTWFGQGLSLPVLVMHMTFLGMGIVLGSKLRKKKAIVYIMLTLVFLCTVCALLMLTSSEPVDVYAVYLGAMFSLIFVGIPIGSIVNRNKIKGCKHEKSS